MACYHIRQELQGKIDILEDERTPYEDFKTDVQTASEALTAYASFLTNLGGVLTDVRLTGQPIDGGTCVAIAGRLTSLVSNLAAMSSTADAAINEINEEINDLELKKNKGTKCYSCQQADIRAAEAAQGNTPAAGGPRSVLYRENLYM